MPAPVVFILETKIEIIAAPRDEKSSINNYLCFPIRERNRKQVKSRPARHHSWAGMRNGRHRFRRRPLSIRRVGGSALAPPRR
ncbi:hypothetical protein, partial [Burkholderia sp. Cy-647]|uniref:hypothetical protein n=1 Tax=Burkholderia sp. Cy-647 TaxID=2608328 RepID=UPI001964D23D